LAAARPSQLRGNHIQFVKFDEKIKSSNYANYTNFLPLRDRRRFSAIIGVTWSDADDFSTRITLYARSIEEI
jgi:hypothetical protein